MNIEHLNNRNWYLAQYNTAGKNRESLFSWLNEQNVVPWTPLITRKIRRADSRCCYRERIFAIFPGYFFILANFDIQPVSALRRHSAFIDFVKFGGEIKPVNKDIVDGLMKIYPDPVLNRKRLVRTVLIFTESSDQLSRATDRVPGLPASPGYVQ